MRYRTIGSMDRVTVTLLALVSSFIIQRAGAEFYIGEYQTVPASSDYSGRNRFKEKQPVFQQDDVQIDDEEEERGSNELVNDVGRSLPPSAKRRQAIGFSPFNPLTPGGTIYLAFIFLIPLTVGKNLAGRRRSSSRTAGLLERLIHKVQQDQQSLYSEMGYVDGNLMLRKAWRDVRDNVAQRLLSPWRRRHSAIDENNDIRQQTKEKEQTNKKKKKKKKKWKPWI